MLTVLTFILAGSALGAKPVLQHYLMGIINHDTGDNKGFFNAISNVLIAYKAGPKAPTHFRHYPEDALHTWVREASGLKRFTRQDDEANANNFVRACRDAVRSYEMETWLQNLRNDSYYAQVEGYLMSKYGLKHADKLLKWLRSEGITYACDHQKEMPLTNIDQAIEWIQAYEQCQKIAVLRDDLAHYFLLYPYRLQPMPAKRQVQQYHVQHQKPAQPKSVPVLPVKNDGMPGNNLEKTDEPQTNDGMPGKKPLPPNGPALPRRSRFTNGLPALAPQKTAQTVPDLVPDDRSSTTKSTPKNSFSEPGSCTPPSPETPTNFMSAAPSVRVPPLNPIQVQVAALRKNGAVVRETREQATAEVKEEVKTLLKHHGIKRDELVKFMVETGANTSFVGSMFVATGGDIDIVKFRARFGDAEKQAWKNFFTKQIHLCAAYLRELRK